MKSDSRSTNNRSRLPHSGRYRQMHEADQHGYIDYGVERLHEYLKDLRRDAQVDVGNGQPPHSEPKRNFGANTRPVTAADNQWKRMMRLHATVPDSTFTERGASHAKTGKVHTPADRGADYTLYESTLEEMFRTEQQFRHNPSPSEHAFNLRRESQTSTDDEDPLIIEPELQYMISFDSNSSVTRRNRPQGHRNNAKPDDMESATSSIDHSTSTHKRNYGKDFFFDADLYGTEPPATEPSPPDSGSSTEDDGYRDLAASLRNIADQIELVGESRGAADRNQDKICEALANQLQLKTEEAAQLRSQIAAQEMEKRIMAERLSAMEAKIQAMKDSSQRTTTPREASKPTEEAATDVTATETLPPSIIDSTDLDLNTRAYIKTLRTNLYVSMEESSSAAFQADLYRDLRSMPDIAHCKEIVDFINQSIQSDAEVLHTRLRHSAMRHGIHQTIVEEHLSPFTNRYPYPPEFEQAVMEELEASHPMRRFSMDPSHKRDTCREKMGIVLNRLVLLAVLKYSHINNLYNYLFTALYHDNFRVVDLLKEAVTHKFLDFQMAPAYSKSVRHPIMWAFGDACNATQAYRYMRMLEFNFSTFPIDPHDGENLWHRVVKGDAVAVAQALKLYMLNAEFLRSPNQRGDTPLDIACGSVRRELLSLIVVELAAKGSECYRAGDYEGALKLYSEAIDKQVEALNIDSSDGTPPRDVNLGKLFYNKARSFMHLDRWTETVESCELCIDHIPSYTNAYVACIQAYEKLLDWPNAAKTCYLMRENCGVVDDQKLEMLRSQIGATMFQILGLPNSASPREIKQAFNLLCKQWHPDKIGLEPANADIKRRAMNQFNRLYEAREKLLDDETRMLEQARPETRYQQPEPILGSSRKTSEAGDAAPSTVGPSKAPLSEVKGDSTVYGDKDYHLLQTAMDRLQQQIDGMHAVA
ncbi:DnaJ domain containing protein, putative [Babesia caballi]|uniref:DnaJ domain containing protein, putative n=1 Tax=Babesia caballi TaxID=5871 RepID=A0AAV4LPM4_BABCB|nr:DnaJ domain containing protein, putative [Babesia caballi]